ncbi:type III-B CRISPR module RAMP protein Cmr6 [Tistrella mobilis]|uniref:type III-B CRISPR module RAMP protein Cmr6 n=1 Tax=Tistrella mobilis TaxID=171437 RepID=UPI003558F02F
MHPNPGLYFDRFYDVWPDKWGTKEEPTAKALFLDRVITCAKAAKTDDALKVMLDRRQKLVDSRYGQSARFKSDWRWTAGLGRSSPVENGFNWHHSLGVPYLPGSSVKGMLRSWYETWGGSADDAKALFGPRPDKGVDLTAGRLIVLDALPVPEVKLVRDVMTPHYGPYYAGGDDPPAPGDWYSPIPIPFLTLAQDQVFDFAILPRRPQDRGILDEVMAQLAAALDWIGAGAKTAVGYGRFTRTDGKGAS